MIIRLRKDQIQLLVEETSKCYPVEACGFIFGNMNAREAVVRKIVIAHNLSNSSTDFRVDPEEFIQALSKAEKEGMEHIGFFHSHPAAPKPSMADIRYMRLWPESIWLIVSSTDHSAAAYEIVNSSIRKVTVQVEHRKR